VNRRPHFAWVIFAATCILSFVGFGLSVNTASLYWGSIEASLGVSLASISLMGTFTGIAGALALSFAGTLFQRFDARLVLGSLVVLAGIAYFVSAAAHDLITLYVANLALGVVKAVAFTFVVPLLLGNWFDKHLGLVVGITGALTAVGGAVFSPIISAIITASGWRAAYVVTGVVILVVLLPTALLLVRFRPRDGQFPLGFDPDIEKVSAAPLTGVSARRAYRSLPFYGFVGAAITLQLAGSTAQHVPNLLTANGVSLTAASVIFSLLLIGASVGKLVIGAALDHLRAPLVVSIFAAIAIVGWLGLGFAVNQTALSTLSFAAGMGQALNLVAIPIFVRTVFGMKDYGRVLSKVMMAGALANAGGVYLHGLFFTLTGSYALTLSLDAAFFVVATALIVVSLQRGRRLLAGAENTVDVRTSGGNSTVPA
jgi:MFS transporter, OFA family, oxalate/formate antiporter